MGDIEKISGKLELSDPKGWNPKSEQFNLPFAVELRENFHIHWQDLRLEMLPDDFENFHNAIHDAYLSWIKDGKPSECLKSDILSSVYQTPLEVDHQNGAWQVFATD